MSRSALSSGNQPSTRVDLPRKPHRLVAAWIEDDRRYQQMVQRNGYPQFQRKDASAIGRRVLRAYDALFKAAERRGHAVDHQKDALRPAWLVIARERIDIEVRQKIRQLRTRLTEEELKEPDNVALNRRWKQTHEPAGTLLFDAFADYRRMGKRRWEDQPETTLEDQIEDILTGLESIAAAAAAKRAEDIDQERRRWEETKRRERREGLRARTERRWNLLREESAAWKEAETLRGFVDAIAGRMGDEPPLRAAAWLRWARARIDYLDPMTGSKEYLFRTLMARPGQQTEEDENDMF